MKLLFSSLLILSTIDERRRRLEDAGASPDSENTTHYVNTS